MTNIRGTGVPAPRIPDPPMEYDFAYMQDVIRALEVFILQERNPGALVAATLQLTDLPTSATGLATGELWNDAGTIKIAP